LGSVAALRQPPLRPEKLAPGPAERQQLDLLRCPGSKGAGRRVPVDGISKAHWQKGRATVEYIRSALLFERKKEKKEKGNW